MQAHLVDIPHSMRANNPALARREGSLMAHHRLLEAKRGRRLCLQLNLWPPLGRDDKALQT